MTTFSWLTPPAPAAIALVRVPAWAALLDRPLPAPDQARFARLIAPDKTVVDELVAERITGDELHLMCHGGPGMRAAVEACLRAHGLTPAPAQLEARWAAEASRPAPRQEGPVWADWHSTPALADSLLAPAER